MGWHPLLFSAAGDIEPGGFPGRSWGVIFRHEYQHQFLAPMAEVEPHGACLPHSATDMGPSLCSTSRLLGHSFLCSRCWLRANTLNAEQVQYLGLQREIFLQVSCCVKSAIQFI